MVSWAIIFRIHRRLRILNRFVAKKN